MEFSWPEEMAKALNVLQQKTLNFATKLDNETNKDKLNFSLRSEWKINRSTDPDAPWKFTLGYTV